jgi:DNA-binding NarL/FixJ family response regulator
MNIVLIEDDNIIRNAYSEIIGSHEGYKVVATYPNAEDAIARIKTDDADVYLVDIELPGMSGLDAIPKIKSKKPGVKIIVVTVYENDDLVFRALCEGAGGYLTKNISPSRLIEAISEINSGGAPMSTNIARLVVSSFHKNRDSSLSARELEVLEKLATGKSYTSIAEELFVDKETIRSHIKNIYLKLEVHSKAEAIEKARKNKFI